MPRPRPPKTINVEVPHLEPLLDILAEELVEQFLDESGERTNRVLHYYEGAD